MSVPSRFLEEVPNQLIENWAGPQPCMVYARLRRAGRRHSHAHSGDFDGQHYNYEDESQEAYNPAAPGQEERAFEAVRRFVDDSEDVCIESRIQPKE